MHTQILLAMALGALAGVFVPPDLPLGGGATFASVAGFWGALFLKALGMLVVPLIAASILSGILGVGRSKGLGRLGLRTVGFYLATSLAAILTGLVLVNLIAPGIVDGRPARDLLGLDASVAQAAAGLTGTAEAGLGDLILRLIPANPVAAAAEGDILPLVVFSILLAVFATRLVPARRQVFADWWQALFDAMMGITGLVMRLAPLGVFGLIARAVSEAGLAGAGPLLVYALTVALALAIHAGITLPLLVWLVGRVSPWTHARGIGKALLTAFSTSSSSATLPVTLECLEDNARVSNRVASFVLPLGATVNMDGTALYECVAALFIAQAYGVELSALQQATVVITALLASIGAAGIPAAGLVMLAVILKAVGLPLEGVGLILAVDRVLDMARTAVNVASDSTCAVIVARLEGETPYAAPPEGRLTTSAR